MAFPGSPFTASQGLCLWDKLFLCCIDMKHGLHHILGIQRLACLGGVLFAVVIMFQYFQFPYGDVISSLFPASKIHINNIESYPPAKASPLPQILGDITRDANSTGPVDVPAERENKLDDSSDLNGIGLSGNQVIGKQNLMLDKIEQSNGFAPENAKESGISFSTDNATTLTAPPNVLGSNMFVSDKDAAKWVQNFTEHETLSKGIVPLANVSSVIEVPRKKRSQKVVSIPEMLDILVKNRASSYSMKPRWSSKADQELLEAKMQSQNVPFNEDDHSLYPSVFRNISIFRRSYELMEKTLKVYIYKEGEKPIFNQPEAVLKGIYASEGWFMMQMKASKRFATRKPKQAHLFYIPYSSKMLKATLSPNSYDRQSVVPYLKNYLDMISRKYSFWNRTGGADHFLVACHDWKFNSSGDRGATFGVCIGTRILFTGALGADETRQFMGTCIRAICNTDVRIAGFELGKDVSLPETNVRYPPNPLRELGGKPPSKRSVFAFFAGKMHGHLRPILLRHWENKDPDMKIFRKLPKVKDDRNYVEYMKSSKFCICAKGSEVNSPRVVEAIFYECVPVIISDNFVPPFFEVLDWESFSVFVQEEDVPNLKTILLSIPKKSYLQMHQRVKEVQQHFLWHVKPVKYDIFHMILHSIWYNRVFRVNPR